MFKSINLLLILVVLVSCKKEITEEKQNSIEKNAINEIKKIVGNQGNIFIIPPQTDSSKTQHVIFSNKANNVNIETFKKLYDQILNDTLPHIFKSIIDSGALNNINSKYKINSISFYEDDNDDPKPAGLYRFTYGPLTNGNSSFFANLNISFNTNQNGSINGNPSLYFSGINLFSWQPQQTSQISFNPITYVSRFAITGTAVFGIQTSGGMTIGWSSNITFYVNINMNQYNFNPVIINGAK